MDNIDTHPLNGLVESIRLHLIESRNTNLSQKNKMSYNNFIKIFKRILSRYKTNAFGSISQNTTDSLIEDIENTNPLMEREWLKQITLNLKTSLNQ